MKVKFKGRTETKLMELECNMLTDNYNVSQREISVVVWVNDKSMFSLKEHFEIEILEQ